MSFSFGVLGDEAGFRIWEERELHHWRCDLSSNCLAAHTLAADSG